MTDSHKLAGLDALRGIAILLVIVAHFGSGLTGGEASIVFGNAGVILFFFLSGFLMDWTLSFEQNVVKYAIRRSFRILPMYWISIALIMLGGRDWTWSQVFSNATFTAPVTGSERMLGVYWTLYIEVLFYCFVPVIFYLGTRAIRSSVYVALVVLGLIAFTHGIGTGAPFYLLFCLCGMQISEWYRKKLASAEVIAAVVIVSGSFGLLMPLPFYMGLVPLACAAMVPAALFLKVRLKPLEFFGTVSYSWYLLHSIFGYGLLTLHVSQPVSLLIGACFTLALSIGAYNLVERPSIVAGKTLIKKYSLAIKTGASTFPRRLP